MDGTVAQANGTCSHYLLSSAKLSVRTEQCRQVVCCKQEQKQ